MHQPLPYPIHGEIGSDADRAVVLSLMRTLTNFRTVGELDSLKMARRLPGGGTALAIHAGGTYRVIIHNPPVEQVEEPVQEHSRVAVPMLFSGVIEQAVVPMGEKVEIRLTSMAQKRLAHYGEFEGDDRTPVPRSKYRLKRFTIDYHDKHRYFLPRTPTNFHYTQYDRLHSSWFSGRMAALAQVAGGYGRQDFAKLPKDNVERAVMRLPARVTDQIEQQVSKAILPGYTGWPPEDGKIRFNFQFLETDGVMFDNERKPWLVNISPRGVYAMPLPLVPATQTKAFREYVIEKKDKELLWLLDTFGGMPSGEGFPPGPGLEAWTRAGVVIKVCGVSDVYAHTGYSTAMGWSFNEAGNEAVVCGWMFDMGDGLQNGRTYKLSARLQAVKEKEPPDDKELEQRAKYGAKVDAYLAGLFPHIPKTPVGQAVRFKIARAKFDELLARAGSGSDNALKSPSQWEAEVKWWDNLKADPIAEHSGRVVCIDEGKLSYRVPSPRLAPQIKFPEPMHLFPGCISHNFGHLDAEGYLPPPVPVQCNTIMHAYYVGNTLKTVRYFQDARTYTSKGSSTLDGCMQVGSWRYEAHGGILSLHGHFYSSDFDERKAFGESTTTGSITGTAMGYDSPPRFEFDHGFSTSGTMWRLKYFMHTSNSSTTENEWLKIGLCIPYLCRNALVHAKMEGYSHKFTTRGRNYGSARDPTSYRIFTYHKIFRWMGTAHKGDAEGVELGQLDPFPEDGNPVYVTGRNYNPGGCSDFADGGPWMGGLPQNVTSQVHPEEGVFPHSGGGSPPLTDGYTHTTKEDAKEWGETHISLLPQAVKLNDEPTPWFFEISPSENGYVFYMDAIKNEAGDAQYANCSELSGSSRTRWGYTSMADHSWAHHFIGVLCE